MLLEASERLLKASAMRETEPASRPAMPLARHRVMLRPMQTRLAEKPALVRQDASTGSLSLPGTSVCTSRFTNSIAVVLTIMFKGIV